MKEEKQGSTFATNAERKSQNKSGLPSEPTRADLRAECKSRGYKNYHAHNKAELIQWLETGVDPRTQKKGLGDYTEKAIDVVTLGTGKKIANAYKRMTGKDCGCEKRKDILNKTGEELLGFLFKGGNLRCPNPQEREMIKSVVVRNQNGKLAIDTTYTPTQLTQLYNAVTGLNHNVPTCKCQSTINTVAEWINRLNGICDMCDAGEEPR